MDQQSTNQSAPSQAKPILVFMGPIGVGKTTIAQEWLKHNPCWETHNFADLVRKTINLVYGIPIEDQKKDTVKNTKFACLGGNTLRYALQHIATEGFRHVYTNTWVDAWTRAVQQSPSDGVVVEDCRFISEFEAALKANAYFIWVTTAGVEAYWERQVFAYRSAFNQFKLALHRIFPSALLNKLGIRAVRMHQSELEIYDCYLRLSSLPRHRVLVIDNSALNEASLKLAIANLKSFLSD